MANYKLRESCAICKNTDLKCILNYGNVPLAGEFLTKDQIKTETKYNLNVMFCDSCSLLQTDSIIDADSLFKDYRYASSTGLSKHFIGVASYLKEKFNLTSDSKVLEIGSNDGVLLKPLSDLAIQCVGFEPATNIASIAVEKGCCVINEYFSENAIIDHGYENKFDLVVSNNCFAHIDDIHAIVRGVKLALKPNGHFVIEVHYVKNLIEQLQYDNIYHEHLYYYSLNSLNKLFLQYGLSIVDYEDISIHAGSIRVVAKNDDLNSIMNDKVVTRLTEEVNLGLTSINWYTDFADKVSKHKDNIRHFLSELKASGKIVVGYGASGRANMLCNIANIGENLCKYIIDESPERYGRYITGKYIPIISKEDYNKLEEYKPDYILIFAWNFSKMIIEKMEKDYHYKYIIPFPEPRIVSSLRELDGFNSI